MGYSMLDDLKISANKIRKLACKEIYEAQSGHIGGAFSICDILAVLYFDEMKIDPKNPRFIKVVWGVGYKADKL